MRLSFKFSLIAFLFLFLSNNLVAQSDAKLVKLADDVYGFGDIRDALGIYKQAIEENPGNVRAQYMAGICYIETINKPRALEHFLKAYEIDAEYKDQGLVRERHAKHLLYLIGMAYQYGHDFDNALSYYERFLKNLSQQVSSKKLKKEIFEYEKAIVDRKIYECRNGKEFIANPVDIKIENIGGIVNSPYPDFSPVIDAEESIMVFTSRRPGGASDDKDNTNSYFEDVYISYKNEETEEWGEPENIVSINTSEHDATVSISPDGKELYIYDDDGGGDIYMSESDDEGNWSKPEPVKEVNSRFRENHLVVNDEGDMMFFTSERDDGVGGEDIYVIKTDDKGKWGDPELLPETINTTQDEDGPFIDLDGKTLYFSSKGHKGMGGYDIFKSVYDEDNDTWSEPENLGYPINSADNDIYIVFSGNGERAYYASAKDEGEGETDIYMIYVPEKPIVEDTIAEMEAVADTTMEDTTVAVVETAKLLSVTLSGNITDRANGQPLSAKVTIRSAIDNSIISVITADAEGYYSHVFSNSKTLSYVVDAEFPSYVFATGQVSVPAMSEEDQSVTKNLSLVKAETGKTFVLRNIYFDFDKWNLKSESFKELDKLENFLKGNPNVSVELGGHTDKIGTNQYNIVLSQRRANACVKYLKNKGIDASRLRAKGYGEEKPLVSNDDEPDGREINRRTEFTIL